MGQRYQIAPGVGEHQLHLGIPRGGRFGDARHQAPFGRDAFAGERADEERPRICGTQRLHFVSIQAVALVVHGQALNPVGADLRQSLLHRAHLGLPVRRRRIHHMQDQIRAPHLVQGALEGLDEGGGQLLDETHRVGQGDFAAAVQFEAARGGVQRGEELVVGQHVRIRETVQQAGFARVGVARQRHFEHAGPVAHVPLRGADLLQVRQLLLD